MRRLLAGDQADLDRDVLCAVTTRSQSMTYVIKNTLQMNWKGAYRDWKGLRTAQVLAACRRLEQRGYLTEVPSSYAVQKCWDATDTGRRHVGVAL
ncbi:hypothetical protein ABE438_14515 [Bosea sp. TWI1241]|uniref:hypothetical protein n=1 Tax=Bosea sp. TWI1241 TaxID=3148904 RepID=UPI0032086AF5